MPIHDWARVDADLFHHFHRCWTVAVCDALNGGVLPPRFSALLERRTPDQFSPGSGLRGDRVVIHRRLSEVVCVVEVISTEDKRSRRAFDSLADQTVQLLRNGVHLLIVDLFPSAGREAGGLSAAIWDRLGGSFEPATEKPLIIAAFVANHSDCTPAPTIFMEPVDVGDALPAMPAFLSPDTYVAVPLEATYQLAWVHCPPSMRELVETGRLADE